MIVCHHSLDSQSLVSFFLPGRSHGTRYFLIRNHIIRNLHVEGRNI